jgi:hypothetical protein
MAKCKCGLRPLSFQLEEWNSADHLTQIDSRRRNLKFSSRLKE